MNNYHYIIAGLPALTQDFENQNFNYKETVASVREQLSPKDNRIIDWLEFGFNSDNLSRHFYRKAATCKSMFISEYFKFDKNIRNVIASKVAAKEKLDESRYTIGKVNTEFEEYNELQQILENDNIIERELQIDKLKWRKITNIVDFHFFDLDVILAFLAKGHIVERWLEMDKETGAKLFEQLVQEVRGTFKGIDNNKENKN